MNDYEEIAYISDSPIIAVRKTKTDRKILIMFGAVFVAVAVIAWTFGTIQNDREHTRVCQQINGAYQRALEGAAAEAAMDWHLHKADYARMGVSRAEATQSTKEAYVAGATYGKTMMEERAGVVCGK